MTVDLAAAVPLMMEYESASRDGIAVGSVRCFFTGFVTSQIVGMLAIVLVSVWTSKYLGGIGWSTSSQIFNYHPLFMVIGFIFLYGDAILVYRVLRNEPKKVLKLVHAGCNGAAFVFALFALWAVIHFHNANSIPNYYSLHSWAGALTLTLFACQFLVGFVSFLFPGVAMAYRRQLMPYHVYFGLAIFVSACATALMGITEKAFFSLKANPSYSDLPSAGVILNLLGVTIIIFCALVVYLVSNSIYKRRPLPEEQALQLEETSSVN